MLGRRHERPHREADRSRRPLPRRRPLWPAGVEGQDADRFTEAARRDARTLRSTTDMSAIDRVLASVEGLDTEEGIRRLAGNRGLYVKLLRQFVEQEAQAPARIRDALNAGDPVLVHALELGGDVEAVGAPAPRCRPVAHRPHRCHARRRSLSRRAALPRRRRSCRWRSSRSGGRTRRWRNGAACHGGDAPWLAETQGPGEAPSESERRNRSPSERLAPRLARASALSAVAW